MSDDTMPAEYRKRRTRQERWGRRFLMTLSVVAVVSGAVAVWQMPSPATLMALSLALVLLIRLWMGGARGIVK